MPGGVEIACDESGFVGGSLFGGVPVFTHASLSVPRDEAAAILERVRRETDSGPGELKASRLHRPWARGVASWLCAPDGPLAGRAVVHVTDTRVFGLARLAQVLTSDEPVEGWWAADELPDAWLLALRLHALPGDGQPLLEAARDLLWVRRRRHGHDGVARWFAQWFDVVRRLGAPDADVLTSPDAVRRAEAYREEPPVSPLTEPLLPAIRWAVRHWAALADGDLHVVHDEQSLLTPVRVEAITGDRAASFTRGDSRDDARLQLADLVAGTVRRSFEDAPAGVQVDHLVADGSILGQR